MHFDCLKPYHAVNPMSVDHPALSTDPTPISAPTLQIVCDGDSDYDDDDNLPPDCERYPARSHCSLADFVCH